MDLVDRRILRILQRDGRITNAELAARVALSPSACLRRVRQLEADGIIAGYGARLDPVKLGRGTSVFVEISLIRQSEDALSEFESAVQRQADVIECYLMAGDSDYLLRVAAADPADYERIHKAVLSRLPGVSRIRSQFALRTVCQHAEAMP